MPADQRPPSHKLTIRQQAILDVIERQVAAKGYPPSVREIGDAVGLGSPSTVHAHLSSLERLGYLRRDPAKPRALEVRHDQSLGGAERRPSRLVPLLGDVAAGTNVLAQENIEELIPMPADFTGEGELFMLRVRGDSMIEDAILDGDLVVLQRKAEVRNGERVVALIDGEEATLKEYRKDKQGVWLIPHNPELKPICYDPRRIDLQGVLVGVMRSC